MKQIIPALVITVMLLPGCGSSKKSLERGHYDAAIDQAVRQLRKNPADGKQIMILERSYKIANEQDNERTRFLKLEAKPENWDEIYLVSKRMADRQTLVRSVTPLYLHGKAIDFPYVDYLPEMVAAKRKSADFYYAHGNELMKNGLKESYRQAFFEFVRAKEYVGDYENIDNKINESKYLGMSRVLVSVQNRSVLQFPQDFEDDLLALDLPRLNSQWVEYHTQILDQDVEYDYFVNVIIRNIAVSPDQTFQRDSVIKREVEDGFSYQLDSRGNVMKDSVGNDIRTKKYKKLQCALIETVQTKECMIEGDVEIVQVNPRKILKKDPVGATSGFEHVSARALGDTGALNATQLGKTKSKPLPFPSDMEMIIRCTDALKQAIRDAIQSNKRFIL